MRAITLFERLLEGITCRAIAVTGIKRIKVNKMSEKSRLAVRWKTYF